MACALSPLSNRRSGGASAFGPVARFDHDLRHSFASALANAGTPLNEIGAILGHRDLAVTQRYAHHAPQRLVQTATVASRTWDLLLPDAAPRRPREKAVG
jgi:integrase